MKLLISMLILAAGPSASALSVAPPQQNVVCIVGATLLDVEAGELVPFRTVTLEGSTIRAVGPVDEVPIPEGARVIDARGAVLTPGLAEMHGHLPFPGQGREFAEDVMFLYLANGITTVRGMLGDSQQLALRDEVARGELAGPRLIVGSPPLHGGATPTAEAAKSQVAQYVEAGYEHLKVHEGLAPDVYAAIAEEASSRDLRFGGHVSDLVGLEVALESGQSTVDHLDNVLEATLPEEIQSQYAAGMPPHVVAQHADPGKFPGLAERFVASQTAVCPSMALWATIHRGVPGAQLRESHPECRYMPAAVVDGWEAMVDQMARSIPAAAGERILALRRDALGALHKGGAMILLGTDSPQMFSVPGFSMRHEAAEMVASGLTPLDVVRSGTLAVHRYYGYGEPFGIQPGARADLVLVRGNPLKSTDALFDIEAVVFGGRVLERSEIEARLASIAQR